MKHLLINANMFKWSLINELVTKWGNSSGIS